MTIAIALIATGVALFIFTIYALVRASDDDDPYDDPLWHGYDQVVFRALEFHLN